MNRARTVAPVGRFGLKAVGACTAVMCTLVALATPAFATHLNFEPNESWTSAPYYGTLKTAFADVNGDGKADAIAVNDDGIYVRFAGKCFFKTTQQWTSTKFFGNRGMAFTDVTGDGKADAIAVKNDGIYVRPSGFDTHGQAMFLAPVKWTVSAYSGARGTFFADVTGDGKADAIAVNNDAIYVKPSYGSGFSNFTENWTTGDIAFYGFRKTAFADVNGDGHADAIAVNDDAIYVRLSSTTYHFFNSTERWTNDGPFYGTRGTFFADVHNDKKADAITVNDDNTVERASDGHQFVPASTANSFSTHGPYYGDVGTFFADVTGDHAADAIAVNTSNITVRRSAFLDGFWDGYHNCNNH